MNQESDTIKQAFNNLTPKGHEDVLRHAIEAYGFLIPWNTTIAASQFANLIRETYSHTIPQVVAMEVEQSNLTFEHNRHGIRAYSEEENTSNV
jgi:hypothetical protein